MVYLARYPAFSDRWEAFDSPVAAHKFGCQLQRAFSLDKNPAWSQPDWEVCHEGNMPDGLRYPDQVSNESGSP